MSVPFSNLKSVAVAVAAVLLAVLPLAPAPATGSATVKAVPAAPLPRLEASSRGIVDASGRQVILRGVNINQLGDYYQADPTLPTVETLTRDDFQQIAAAGFNHVRLTMSWSNLEPARGVIDAGQIARIHQAVGWAKDAGLYVVLDMHQDAWGKYIASPPGTTCPAPLTPAVGWDGAPAWATYADGLTTCRLSMRELSPAVAAAWQNFWIDRDGIQGELVNVWKRLGQEFGNESNIAGFDLLNEPHPGLTPGPNQAVLFAAYYARAIAAVRAGERAARGGFAHLVFFEPSVLWSGATVDAVPAPGFTLDKQVVFAPHLYAESISSDRSLGASVLTIENGWRFAETVAAAYATPLWVGEWGWFGSDANDLSKVQRYVASEDQYLAGGAWWVWKMACGDPHAIGATNLAGSLHPLNCPSGTPGPVRQAFLNQITRTYPRYAPGQLTSVTSDGATGSASVAGSNNDPSNSCRLVVWVPDRGLGAPSATVTGVTHVGVERTAGGWLVTGCATGSYRLSVRPT